VAEECEFGVHHFLDDGGGIDAGQVVIFKGRHKWDGAGCNDEILCVNVIDFIGLDIFDGKPFALQDIPNGGIKEDRFMVVASKIFCYVESPQAAEFFFFFEEKELMCLHEELSTDAVIAVNDNVGYIVFFQLLPGGQAGRACSDNRDFGPEDLCGFVFEERARGRFMVARYFVYLFYAIYLCDADSFDLAVDEHFAGAAFADSAFKASISVFEAVAMDGETGLVESGGDREALLADDFFSLVFENCHFGRLYVEDGVFVYFVH
jgi:hypothetical protein